MIQTKTTKITHLGIYQIYKDNLFANVNSYSQMNTAIEKYGGSRKTEVEQNQYFHKTGMAFEIFNQYFFIRYNGYPNLGVTNIKDTSDNPYNPGFDFSYTDLNNKFGLIQSKWRSNPLYQFELGSLSTAGEAAMSFGVIATNNILFINFDDREDLFHFKYKNARNNFRIIDRKTQENLIIHDPNFWNDFRKCIEKSAKNYFKDPYNPRDVQEWAMYGNKERGFAGTIAVINGTYDKGRVEAATASGKSLCIYYNIIDVFKHNRDIVTVVIPWKSLIYQTFDDYYINKLFGWEDEYNQVYDTNISCVVIMSGETVRFNNTISDVHQCLSAEEVEGKVLSLLAKGRKIVIMTTMKSYNNKYTGIIDNLFEKGVKKDQVFEIIDEFHNLIPTSGERIDHLKRAEFLVNYNKRNSGVIFYSASNKIGEVVNSFDEAQFGPLLAKITRNDLYERGYVCPQLKFKIIRVKNTLVSADDRRTAERKGIDINKAQTEAAAIAIAYNDLKQYYTEPNLITFGNHVAGCRFISEDETLIEILGDVNMHFMSADTHSNERENIIESIRKSGNNILNQHSVAKEGVNLPNLHAGLIDRGMDYKTAQQAIGRSDRALHQDTINFEKGLISLDSPEGWLKYYNVIYVVVDDDDTSFMNRIKDLVKYLLSNGIPREKWDIAMINDEERVDATPELTDNSPEEEFNVIFDRDKLDKIIAEAIVLANEEIQSEIECMDNHFTIDYTQAIETAEREDWLSSMSAEEYLDYCIKIIE